MVKIFLGDSILYSGVGKESKSMAEKFGTLIKRKRFERGILTVKAAAKLMGVTPPMLQQYEAGVFLPDPASSRGLANLKKICQFYDLPVDCIARVNEERIERKREKPRFLEELSFEEREIIFFFRGPGRKELFSSVIQKMDDGERELLLLFRRLTQEEKSNLFFILRKFVG